MATLAEVLALLPDNITGDISAADMRQVITDVWEHRESGTTANRPTVTIIGWPYFDTTLGHPIWWNGTAWVDAFGITV